MGKALETPPTHRSIRTEIDMHTARIRASLEIVREVLRREPLPDTFLGRQHYDLMPLPHQEQSVRAICALEEQREQHETKA